MSILSFPTTRTPGAERPTSSNDVDARFDALVRSSLPAQRGPSRAAEFEAVFDLDYRQPLVHGGRRQLLAPLSEQRSAPQPSGRIRWAAARVQAPESKPSLRLTRRGRLVVVLASATVALALMVPLGGWATASLSSGSPEPVRVIEVAPGQTLYGIAGDLAPAGEVRDMVHRIQQLNSLSGAGISEGQKLSVPRG